MIGFALLKRAVWAASSLFALAYYTTAGAASLTAPPLNCPTSQPGGSPGSEDGTPGNWRNPDRPYTGWALHYGILDSRPQDPRNLAIYWFTYDASGRPVWLLVEPRPVEHHKIEDAALLKVTYDSEDFEYTASPVGLVSATFPTDSSTYAAIRWKWSGEGGYGTGYHDECIYNFFREDTNALNSLTVNESFSGVWREMETPGWGMVLDFGIDQVGNRAEVGTAAIFNTAGEPTWVQSQNVNPQWLDWDWVSNGLFHFQGQYQVDGPCTVSPCASITELSFPANHYARAFTGVNDGVTEVVVNYDQIGGQSVHWPPANWPPPTGDVTAACHPNANCRPFQRLTGSEQIWVSQSSCVIPYGSDTCPIFVSWSSSNTGTRVYRKNLGTGTSALLGVGQTAEVQDNLGSGSYQYRLELPDAEPGPPGLVVWTTPSVTATAALPPDDPTPPQLPSVPTAENRQRAVGFTGGDFKVDEAGSATYRVPIYAPPGRGGFAPQFSLDYNSSYRDGVVGWGWKLAGASVISICRLSEETDGESPQFTFDVSTHAFCLDGKRLVPMVAGHHGGNGDVYRPELDDFQKVVIDGVESVQSMPPTFTQPLAFIVYGKDGTIRKFGKGATSDARRHTSDPGFTTEWAEYERSDSAGNKITFSYSTGPAAPPGQPVIDGRLVLESASYVGGEIDFQYDDLTTSKVAYYYGSEAIVANRLATVEVKDAAGGALKKYNLAYDINEENISVAFLKGIEECASNSCLPVTVFEWNDQNTYQNPVGRIGDDIFNNFRVYKPGDVDGDGRTDIVWVDSSNLLNISFSRVDSAGTFGFTTVSASQQGIHVAGGDHERGLTWGLLDFDADGRQDLVWFDTSGSCTPSGAGCAWKIRLSNGLRFDGSEFTVPDSRGSSSGVVATLSELILADFDGNGLTDMLVAYPSGIEGFGGSKKAWTLTRAEPGGNVPYEFEGPWGVSLLLSPNNNCPIFTFFNNAEAGRNIAFNLDGDGRSDLALRNGNCNHQTPILPPWEIQAIDPTLTSAQQPDVEMVASGQWESRTAAWASQGGSDEGTVLFRSLGVVPSGTTGKLTFRQFFDPFYENSVDLDTLHLVDINADGYTDIAYESKDNGAWRYRLGVGRGFTGWSCVLGEIPCSAVQDESKHATFLDYDGDGKLDFWYMVDIESPAAFQYSAKIWNGDGFSQTRTSFFLAGNPGEWVSIHADLDGDGYYDNLFIQPEDGSWKLNRSATHHQVRNTINTIVQGLGAITEIHYQPATYRSVYQPERDGATMDSGRGTVVQDVLAPIYLVNRVESSAPTQGHPLEMAAVRYRYSGLRMQAGGRGTLGFHKVYTLAGTADSDVDIETITEYEQRFPLSGMPVHTRAITTDASHAIMTTAPGGWVDVCANGERTPGCFSYTGTWSEDLTGRVVLSDTQDIWNWKYSDSPTIDPPIASPPAPIFVYRAYSQTVKKGLDGALLSAEATDFTGYDAHGNLLGSTSTNYADAGMNTVARTVTTVNAYDDDETLWFLGRLDSSTVTTSRPGTPPITRSTAFSYDDATGLLDSETIQPKAGPDLKLSKYYAYDAYGNRTGTYTCSGDVSSEAACRSLTATNIPFRPTSTVPVRRYSTIEYDANGILPYAVREPYFNGQGGATEQASSTTLRDAFGNPTRVTDANGFIKVAGYDALGRKYFEGDSTGAYAQLKFRWCTGTDNTADCPKEGGTPYAAYMYARETPAEPYSWAYFDVLDREVLTIRQGFAGEYIAVRKTYDEEGRPKATSEPYVCGSPHEATVGQPLETVYWTTISYDALGRITRITYPNGSTTDTAYAGRTVVTTLPPTATGHREQKTAQSNFLGEIELAKDDLTTEVHFIHDATGNVLSTERDTWDGDMVTTTATYDVLGRRQTLSDPDAGNWTYVYNALGELVRQTGGTTCTQSLYDARGRVWSRKDYANGTCSGTPDASWTWTFDTDTNGFGQLDFVQGDDADVHYERFEHHDAMGRVESVETQHDGGSIYTERTTYDQFGRLFQRFFTGTGLPEFGEVYEYNSYRYPLRVRDAVRGSESPIYREVLAMDSRGHVTEEMRANEPAMTTQRTYEPSTGRLLTITSNNGALQQLEYGYDPLGNVILRKDDSDGAQIWETYEYDALQRLTATHYRTPSGSIGHTVSATYDGLGNRYRLDAAGQPLGDVYGRKETQCNLAGEVTPGSGALSQLGSNHYCYDAHGNRTRVMDPQNSAALQKQSILYSAYDKAREIRFLGAESPDAGGHTTGYHYGPERQKFRRTDWFANFPAGSSDSTEYVGTTEILRPSGATYRDIRRRVGGAIVVNRIEDDDGDPGSDGTEIGYAVYYEFTDALGSPHRITDQWGQPYLDDGSQWFVPFGMRADSGNGDPLDAAERLGFPDTLTRHGWTGHEHADRVGMIQMGGRLYDAEVGRFVQPDPFVQDPFDGQTLNRYSYLLNNPLSGTDPSGYWGAKEQGYLRTVVAIVIAVYTGYYINVGMTASTMTATQAAGYAALGGAASGAVATGTLRGAVTGAFTGAVGFGIGQAWSAGTWQYVAANATAGGVTEELNGGRFGHGFVSAGLSSTIAPQINTGNDFGDGVAYAMLGGTTSVISGGKFGNGAVTGALQFAMGKAGERAAQNRRMEQAAAFDYESAMAFEPPSLPQEAVDFSAGMGDSVSLDATSYIRSSYGIDGGVNEFSDAYRYGAYAGAAVSLLAGAGPFRGAYTFGRTARVTRWGGEGMWYMVGGKSTSSWWLSGTRFRYPYSSAVTSQVPVGRLAYPSGWEWIKGLIGQRTMRPGP